MPLPPLPHRLREVVAFALLAFGMISTLFGIITLLFGPGGCADSGIGAMTCVGEGRSITFSFRALGGTGALLNPVVTLSTAGAVVVAFPGAQPRLVRPLAMVSLITVGAAALFGTVALFASVGADGAPGFMKTTNFFVGLGELCLAGSLMWVLIRYFQFYGPAPYGPQPPTQWAPGHPSAQQQPQQWGPQGPASPHQGWGPGPQQQWQPAPHQAAPHQPAPHQPAPHQPAPHQPAPHQPAPHQWGPPQGPGVPGGPQQ